jgi:hypothetical protein
MMISQKPRKKKKGAYFQEEIYISPPLGLQ